MREDQRDDVVNKVFLGKEFTHTMEVESKVNPEWKGKISFKLPSIKDLMQSAAKQVQLRGGLAPELIDGYSNYVTRATAELSVVVVEAPAWWYRVEKKGRIQESIPAPEEIQDIELILTIWEGYVAFRDNFSNGGGGQADSQPAEESKSLERRQASEPQSV